MTTKNQTMISKDPGAPQLLVVREFDAPVEKVWKAWTDSSLLDQWWAPRPWKAKTKKMDFREGGYWLYAMVGPDGTEQHCRADYEKIIPNTMFSGMDGFCDAQGNVIQEPPGMHWTVQFTGENGATRVEVTVRFNSEADLNTIVQMGFKEGFTAAHGNLDELLAKGV